MSLHHSAFHPVEEGKRKESMTAPTKDIPWMNLHAHFCLYPICKNLVSLKSLLQSAKVGIKRKIDSERKNCCMKMNIKL